VLPLGISTHITKHALSFLEHNDKGDTTEVFFFLILMLLYNKIRVLALLEDVVILLCKFWNKSKNAQ
jgi:hypothetical protein